MLVDTTNVSPIIFDNKVRADIRDTVCAKFTIRRYVSDLAWNAFLYTIRVSIVSSNKASNKANLKETLC